MKSRTSFFLGLGMVLLVGTAALGWVAGLQPDSATVVDGSNVVVADGVQIITINAKGGYLPGVSEVQAGIPTILRFETRGSFDCSTAVNIPSLGISTNLPPTGSTDVAIGILPSGTLQGTCGMGMYRFEINAKS